MKNEKQSENQAPIIQAMVWYKEEDWEKLIEMFTDGHLLPKSYADWLKKADKMVEQLEAAGDVVIKVFIDPVTFPAWCKKKGRKMDMKARTDLAIEVATKQSFGPKV
ncbi:MAG: hypothetical protein KKD01_09595 [Proteobacteria bacterium]|nr:hypothetical protein [Pseudomonadota bacterium]MBU1417696.1 hypothetical protein [Pseudomonadota bacterium]MBU1454964.1 hypothetical protein [Pseudomonadota bacterium]